MGEDKEIRTRLAPSPTGPLHLGTVRTALFNWLFARHYNGEFILRIEDTDKERSKKEYETQIIEGLKWLGLNWDNDLYRQSERTEIYKKYLQKLLDEKKAYYCYCTKEELEAQKEAMITAGLPPKYSGHCRNLTEPPKDREPQVIRFKMPETQIVFEDLIKGKVEFDASLFGDIVIAKNLEEPLYNFAVVVDDYEMKITHVIRGEDHLSNTPKQIAIANALGFKPPIYAHLPLILSPDRSKMSKRYMETSFLDYKEQGYLPEALINFLALLGWHDKGDREIFSLEELIEKFDIKRIQKTGAVFDIQKLNHFNAYYLKKMGVDKILDYLKPELIARKIDINFAKKIISIELPRMETLNDFFKLSSFFFELPAYQKELLAWKNTDLEKTKIVLEKILTIMSSVDSDKFNMKNLSLELKPLIIEEGNGRVLWPLRVALSGLPSSPPPLEIAEILGKDESLRRLKIAIAKF
jgi:glutamyl-tRNA synthetase